MLSSLKKYNKYKKPFYGINAGSYGFLISFLFNILINDFLIFDDLIFLSEIIWILLILMVPSARLELALRKRQGF